MRESNNVNLFDVLEFNEKFMVRVILVI